jgi:hypothetical protein
MNVHSKDSSAATVKPLSAEERSAINQSAIANILPILERLLPGGTVRGQDYVVRNPTRADKAAGSFKVCVAGPKVGVWSDFATNDKGGDPTSLVAYIRNCSKNQAARMLRNYLNARTATRRTDIDSSRRSSGLVDGSTVAPPTAPHPVAEIETLPAPESAESISAALARPGNPKPDQRWLYRTADGSKAFYIVRWNKSDGSKTIRPCPGAARPRARAGASRLGRTRGRSITCPGLPATPRRTYWSAKAKRQRTQSELFTDRMSS